MDNIIILNFCFLLINKVNFNGHDLGAFMKMHLRSDSKIYRLIRYQFITRPEIA